MGKCLRMKTGVVVVVLLLFTVLSVHVAGFASAQTQTITIDNAVQLFQDYLARLGNPDLALHEVEEYQNNFYASYFEKSTGGMMAGVVMSEPGPNLLWNTKYGVMGGMMGVYRQTQSDMTVTAAQANALAQQYLDSNFPGETAGDADTYYGYYNIDVLKGVHGPGLVTTAGMGRTFKRSK